MLIGGIFSAVFDTEYMLAAILQAVLSGLLSVIFAHGANALMDGNEKYAASLLLGFVFGGMADLSVLGIPLVLVGVTLFVPYLMSKKIMTGADGRYIRQGAVQRLNGFAASLDSLATAMKSITDSTSGVSDTARLYIGLKKGRAMLSDELFGISALLKELAKDISKELVPDSRLGKELKGRVKRCGIACGEVLVKQNGESELCEVSIERRKGSCRECCATLIPLVSKTVGVNMVRCCDVCHIEGKRCTLRLCAERNFRLSTYAAVRICHGNDVSGDSHTFMELKRGKYMLALSDGMGSGGKARAESAASVELFEDFMEAGFDRDFALEQINTLLLMRAGDEDIFATLDICNVDLYSGTAEFVKIGAMPSFVSSNDGVRIIGGGGLPIGIVEDTCTDSTEVMLKDGDVIVMLTDGVVEAAPCAVGKENWLARIIDENRRLSPQALCDKILASAAETDGGVAMDDMTVMVAKVQRV
jgi:stage II sporulation protein E